MISESPVATRTLAVALCGGLLAFAFVAAPASCAWGWTAYVWTGLAIAAALLALPLLLRPGLPPGRRVLLALAFGTIGAGVWVGGIFAANFRIVCSLI